ncbi:hypothetical protein B0T19DRAFT_213394 [Cercophora scortea]|uniref:Uncharacterized protein n=1 Tax=Cercophora scortea TaxID=314031 RepID=A0AAE0IEQ6_9PEZI|nr:hypothetical protein B0T19DRAFT_213394 [Cercophora scortea]
MAAKPVVPSRAFCCCSIVRVAISIVYFRGRRFPLRTSTHNPMLYAEAFIGILLLVVWGLVSCCAALHYMNLLPHEARRRWPVLEKEGCLVLAAPALLFIFAVFFWPAIATWDFSARHCVGTKTCCGVGSGGFGGSWCGGCKPCISQEVYDEERARRREAHIRMQHAFLTSQPPGPGPTMELPEYRVVQPQPAMLGKHHRLPSFAGGDGYEGASCDTLTDEEARRGLVDHRSSLPPPPYGNAGAARLFALGRGSENQ